MRLQVHSVLRTLSSVLCLLKVGLTVLGRPRRDRVDPLISWPVDEGEAGRDTDQQGRWSLPK